MSSTAAISIEAKNQPKAGLEKMFVQRTVVLARPGADLTAACLALTLQAKNLYNTAHFAVKNVLSAYDQMVDVWIRNAELHEHQVLAIERFNAAVDKLNAARKVKHEVILAAGGERAEKAKLVLIPRLEGQVESVLRTVLDITALDNVMREWPGLDGTPVYTRMPAKCAQLVLHRYKNAWSGYFESLKSHAAGNAVMTGRPRPPDYLAKHDHYVLELPLTQIGECLIGLGERKIPVDFAETVSLSEKQLQAWNSFRIGEAVEQACECRGFGAKCQAQHLRIVPHRGGVRFEAVVRVSSQVPEDSLLARLQAEIGNALPEKTSKRNELYAGLLADRNVPAAGIDFGVSNTAAIAFSMGHRAKVISAGRLEQVLGEFDRKIDELVARLTSPETRALQTRITIVKAEGTKPSRSDTMALRKALKAIYATPEYRALRGQRERWLSDYLHKLSHGIVHLCAGRGVQALVLGQNKGWKDGMEMGAVQNRRFGRIPIARLIELIRYKAEALGLVVVTTEESYTSRTSFVNNQPMAVHEGKSKKKDGAVAAGTSTPTAPAQENPAPLGKRLKHERHTFVNHDQTGRWARVHADVNAAFNIVRKVFRSFEFHAGLTLKYTLLRVSPRLGLTPMRI